VAGGELQAGGADAGGKGDGADPVDDADVRPGTIRKSRRGPVAVHGPAAAAAERPRRRTGQRALRVGGARVKERKASEDCGRRDLPTAAAATGRQGRALHVLLSPSFHRRARLRGLTVRLLLKLK